MLCCMAAVRTQVYLTTEQRKRIDQMAARDGITLAEVVRQALDQYFAGSPVDEQQALNDTFGACPEMVSPSRGEWLRG